MPKILIIDDDVLCLKLYKDIIGATGIYEIICSEDPGDILKLLQEVLPDLVILDIKFKGTTGIRVMELIKSDGRFNKIPFLAISGYSSRDSKEYALRAGFTNYVPKPVSIDVLMSTISNMIGV